MARGEFFDVVELGSGVVIDHHIERREGLQEVLFDTSSPAPHSFDDIGA